MTPNASSNVVQTVVDLDSLVNNLLLLLSDKEKTVIKKRFDLDNGGKCTLEEIGNDFAVTRERVRQIERNALNKMGRNVFNTALRHFHDYTKTLVDHHGGLMKEDLFMTELSKIMPSGFELNRNAVRLSMVLHEGLDSVGNTINFHPYLREKALVDYTLKHASKHVVNQLHKYGNVKPLDKLCSDLSDLFEEFKFDINRIKSLIEIDKRVTLLDDELVGLLEWRHVNPRTLRDKILYILRANKKPTHFNDISAQIEKEIFDNRSVNVQAIHNELIRHDQFVLIGRGIYALAEWGYESGTVANVIERILQAHNELTQEEIVDKVLSRRQVKKITVILALKNGKQFERVGRKKYRLNKV